ncbi:unnamed protein product [Nippostrongylus brasiliensis]|uniref:HTH_38 domain-containing protein n=1 Tax=Nippostrongylus brasiliensis TaxID=27835 RepID=A0A0N4Y9I7_NIPBR|nr:unnamed protein product [Nippostrongylus brasiliensis]
MPVHGAVLSIEERAKIRALKNVGFSIRAIARQLGRLHGCIDRFPKNSEEYPNAHAAGRQHTLSSQDRLASNSTLSVNQIRSEMGLIASGTVIWRSIRSNQYILREATQKTPRFTNDHRLARLEFAWESMTTLWDKVIFTDEKKFNLNGPYGYRLPIGLAPTQPHPSTGLADLFSLLQPDGEPVGHRSQASVRK